MDLPRRDVIRETLDSHTSPFPTPTMPLVKLAKSTLNLLLNGTDRCICPRPNCKAFAAERAATNIEDQVNAVISSQAVNQAMSESVSQTSRTDAALNLCHPDKDEGCRPDRSNIRC